MNVGDVVYKKIEFGMEGATQVPPQRGVITYIHPDRWFYQVTFTYTSGGGTRPFRQCYPLKNRITVVTGQAKPEVVNDRETHPRGAVAQAWKPEEQGAYFPVKKQKRRKRKK